MADLKPGKIPNPYVYDRPLNPDNSKNMAASIDQVLPPTTTAEEDRRTKGQRGINRTWENVQAILAISVVWTALLVVLVLIFRSDALSQPALTLISALVGSVVGFYFGRTNHARIGDESKLPGDDRK